MAAGSLVSLLINEQWRDLEDALLVLIQSDEPINLQEIFFILREATLYEIVGLCLELFYVRRSEVFRGLLREYYATDSKVLQMYLLVAILTNADFEGYQFGLLCYLDDINMRPYIRSTLFKDKQKLCLALMKLVEVTRLSAEQKETVKDILRIIPRHIYLNISKYTADMKLHELYFQIDAELPIADSPLRGR